MTPFVEQTFNRLLPLNENVTQINSEKKSVNENETQIG